MTREDIDSYIAEYVEMEETFLGLDEEKMEDSESSHSSTKESIPPLDRPAFVVINDFSYNISNIYQVVTRVTPNYPKSPFGTTTYTAEWSKDGIPYETLMIFKNKDSADECSTQFLNDLKAGQTVFDAEYFQEFEPQNTMRLR